MAVLPTQGGSENTWGTELNAWLVVEHSATGSHNTVGFLETISDHLLFDFDGNMLTDLNGELVYI